MRASDLLSAAVLASTLAIGAALFAPVHAQDTSSQTPALTATPAGSPWLSIRELLDRLQTEGYRDFSEVERKSDRYEVKAINPQGERVEIDVDPLSAQVLKTEIKRDKR